MKTHNASPQLSIQTSEQAYQITAWKAFAIFAGSVLSAIVGTAFAVGSTLNNDHFLTVSNTDRISAIEKTAVRQDVLFEQLEPMKSDLTDIKADIKILMRENNK